ncbi:MAG: DUF4260 domain-containing protein [Bacteroidetes bacterium]|nr:DUF4260 domain-containing protein [Bacteroidota bacterium]
MNVILKLEELVKFLACWYFATDMGFEWWLFFVWLLAPDISMLGYLAGTKTGAFFYNLFHHQGVAIAVCALGYVSFSPEILFAGLILAGHSCFDRILGYGLKFDDHFKHTHLGWIGGKEQTNP